MCRCAIIAAVCCFASLLPVGCESESISIREAPIAIKRDTPGSGRSAKPGDLVTIQYRVSLPNGKQVLESSNYRFFLGQGAVISGFDEAVKGMQVGGRRIVRCPPNHHWGRQGYADIIPPNTQLTFDIRLIAIQ